MRLKVAIPALLLLVVSLVVIWRLGSGDGSRETDQASQLGNGSGLDTIDSDDSASQPHVEGGRRSAEVSSSSQDGGSISSPSSGDNNPLSRLTNSSKRAQAEYLEKAIRSIEFYGKAVDENLSPVAGATVEFSATYTNPPSTTQSDEDGLFSVSGVFARVLHVFVNKPGYYSSRSNQIVFDYSPELAQRLHRPDPDHPVLFHLRRKGEGADLVTSEYGVHKKLRIAAPIDGRTVFVDLLGRASGPSGPLAISQAKPPPEQLRTARFWEFRMDIPNGGFVEHSDEFPFEAPANGYRSTVQFGFDPDEQGWTNGLREYFYIAFGHPRKYGWLTVETTINTEAVRLEYAINPDGSRYLEPRQPQPPMQNLPPGAVEVVPGRPDLTRTNW